MLAGLVRCNTTAGGAEAAKRLDSRPFTCLGYCLVVDADQVARRGVDLESLVEGEGGLDRVGRCMEGGSAGRSMACRAVDKANKTHHLRPGPRRTAPAPGNKPPSPRRWRGSPPPWPRRRRPEWPAAGRWQRPGPGPSRCGLAGGGCVAVASGIRGCCGGGSRSRRRTLRARVSHEDLKERAELAGWSVCDWVLLCMRTEDARSNGGDGGGRNYGGARGCC